MTRDSAQEQQPDGEIGRSFALAAAGHIYRFLASSKLAIVLLVAILTCCVLGVTAYRENYGTVIFSSLWFNSILVLLVVNVAFCFFGRIGSRKLTVVSLGMILFHMSFVAMLAGIVYNSLFYFKAIMLVTEGETVSNGESQSYSTAEAGYFFDHATLKGETTLIRIWTDYKVDGALKKVAYEIEVGDGITKKRDIVYLTHKVSHGGFQYIREMEGYSILTVLSDTRGKELYGAHIPLQSIRQGEKSYLYTTGTKSSPGTIPFPYLPEKPLFNIQAVYRPDLQKERAGDVLFTIWPLEKKADSAASAYDHGSGIPGEGYDHGSPAADGEKGSADSLRARLGSKAAVRRAEKPLAEGRAAVGETVKLADYFVTAREVRYWAGINVRHDPGHIIVLTSLWVGLGGMVLTTIGRMLKRKTESAGAASAEERMESGNAP